MQVTCPHCGNVVVVNGLGRPRGKYPVQNVLKAYKKHQNIPSTADVTGLSTGTIWRILKDNGVTIKNARGKKK